MILTRKVTLALTGVVAAAVLGTAGVAAATAETAPAPAATERPAATEKPAADKDRARPLLKRGLHGEWVVKGKDGKPTTLVSVRGQVTAVSGTSVTVKAEDGYTATFVANGDTKVKGADVDSMADVKVGAKGAVVGVKNGDTLTARAVLVRK